MRKVLLLLPFFLWTCGGGSTETEPPQLPTVTNIEITTLEDTQKIFAFSGSDPQNLALSYTISSQPQHGTVSVNGGAGTYSPNANYNGTDIFYYIASSSGGNSNIGTVVVTVTPVDDEPNTMDATAVTDEDNPVDIILSAEEYDGDNVQFQVRNNPSNGSVTISGTTANYVPSTNFNGTDTFNFEAVDISSKSILNTATATITVNPINDAPTVMDITDIEVSIGTSVDITLLGSDVDGDNLTYSIVDNPTTGSVNISGDVATFTANSAGAHSFTYKANDSILDSETGTVLVNMRWDYATYGGTGTDWGIAVRQTSDGGYILGGLYTDNMMYAVKTNVSSDEEWSNTYDSGFISSITQLSDDSFIFVGGAGGTDDIRLIKISNGGTVEWNKGFVVDGYNLDVRSQGQHSLQLTSDGGYIIAAGIRKNGISDAYAIKTDASGNKLWSKTYEGLGVSDDQFVSVEQTSDGGFIFAGQTRHSSKGAQFYLVKTNANGTEEWSADYGGSAGDGALSVEQTSDGGYILSGVGNGTEGYVVKTDATGQIEFEVNDSDAYFNSGIEAFDGGYIIVGRNNNPADYNLLVLKLSANGNEVWRKEYGGTSGRESGNSVSQTSDGGYVIFGTTASYGNGGEDMYLINIDSEGNRIY